MCVYELRNTDTKCFFAEFQRDPVKHAKILADRTLRHEIKLILDKESPVVRKAEGREVLRREMPKERKVMSR